MRQISGALRTLNSNKVRALADRPVTLGILAADEVFFGRVVSFLMPESLSEAKAAETGRHILRLASEEDFERCQFGFAEPGLPHPRHFHQFDWRNPDAAVETVLKEQRELWVPIARRFFAFRDPVIERLIWKISKENAMFTVATALPNVVPSIVSLPWAIGEFASGYGISDDEPGPHGIFDSGGERLRGGLFQAARSDRFDYRRGLWLAGDSAGTGLEGPRRRRAAVERSDIFRGERMSSARGLTGSCG